MAKVRVNVSVADDHRKDFAAVAKRCRDAGLNIAEQLEGVGVLSGSVERKQIAALRKLRGVGAVEEERRVGVPPPDEDVQ